MESKVNGEQRIYGTLVIERERTRSTVLTPWDCTLAVLAKVTVGE